MSKIKTSGQLREFLCDTIVRVASGDMDVDSARNITKLAAQVTENLYAEAKITRLQHDLNQLSNKFGELIINSDKE